MTAEEYIARSFAYADYVRLSQWQRLRLLRRFRRVTRVHVVIHVWPLTWRWGLDQSQEYGHLHAGPLELLVSSL